MHFFIHEGELYATDDQEKWFVLMTHGQTSPEFWTWYVLTPAVGFEKWMEYKQIADRQHR